MSKKQNIAVIMGGYSSEVGVSLKSGARVCKELDGNKYKCFPVHILHDKWVYVDGNKNEFPITKGDFSLTVLGEVIHFDAVFNAIHGNPGENGYMQAYFYLLGIPISGCRMYNSAVTFNKRDCLSILKPYGIKCANSFYLNKEDKPSLPKIIEAVGIPCFVKANKAGSSYGVIKVSDKNKLPQAIEEAFKEDDELIIESMLVGREFTVGVVTYKNEIVVLPITEIISDNDFFDFEAKYLGKSQEITPADISKNTEKKIKNLAQKIYKSLRLVGPSRSEFIVVDGMPHLLEVNTVPGLTEESILPQQLSQYGISLSDYFDDLIQQAIKNQNK